MFDLETTRAINGDSGVKGPVNRHTLVLWKNGSVDKVTWSIVRGGGSTKGDIFWGYNFFCGDRKRGYAIVTVTPCLLFRKAVNASLGSLSYHDNPIMIRQEIKPLGTSKSGGASPCDALFGPGPDFHARASWGGRVIVPVDYPNLPIGS